LSCVVGCGGGGPFEYVPVDGKITYEDGSPIPLQGARILFIALDAPDQGTVKPRPAMADVNEQGEFACVTSYKYGDGLIPGEHKVVIQGSPVRDGKPIFPKACASSADTPLRVTTENTPLAIKVPKP
jgi:hypothetical protein